MIIQYDPSALSNLTYVLKRILLRAVDNFWLFLLISIVITMTLILFYYSFTLQIIKAQVKRVVSRILPRKQPQVDSRQVKKNIYQQRRQRVKKKRRDLMRKFE